jgi:quinol monooxygenase YgiN
MSLEIPGTIRLRGHMSFTHVRMTIEWSVPIGQTRPIAMALYSLAADVRPTLGCVSCSVSTDIAEHGVVRYAEEWRTEEDLRLRVNADTFVQLITLMEESAQPPQIEFALARGTRGIEFVEEVRSERLQR